ncbi:MAG: cystathionine beta-lyase [Collimonas sp.]
MNYAKSLHVNTRLGHAGRKDKTHVGPVNPPLIRASTMLFPDVAQLNAVSGTRWSYGRHGCETSMALENALCAAEGAHTCLLTPSGLSAITTTLLALLKPGDHLLMTDSGYDSARTFCDGLLRQMGVATTYYDPLAGAGIAALIRPDTKVIFVESPGSLTFEVQDIPAIADAAHRHGALVVADSTWATPLGWPSFKLGIDVSIHAATKYIVGHSDVLMGAILTTEALGARLRRTYRELGVAIGADDAYLALRGLRTMAARLAMHRDNAQHIGRWLQRQPEVETVLYPPLEGSPGHTLWKRDFHAEYAGGLMGVVMRPEISQAAVTQLINQAKLFGIGYSWGGYESLMIPVSPGPYRSVTSDRWPQQMLRIHVGLEAASDLIDDLDQSFEALRNCR